MSVNVHQERISTSSRAATCLRAQKIREFPIKTMNAAAVGLSKSVSSCSQRPALYSLTMNSTLRFDKVFTSLRAAKIIRSKQ
eukprot:3393176-Amphidinium_carterae.1